MRFLPLLLISSLAMADVTVNGFVTVLDAGVRLVDRNGREATYVEDGHVQAALDTTLVADRASGTTLNTNVWTGNVTTQTIDTLSGFYRLNASGITTLNATSQLQTVKLHSMGYSDIPIFGVAVAKVAHLPLANSTAQLGFLSAAALTAPTDGCYFEWNASAEFRAVSNTNGVISQSGVLANPSANIIHVFTVKSAYYECEFSVDGNVVALIASQNLAGTQPILSVKLPYAARIVTSASAPLLAPSLQVAAVTTYLTASNVNAPIGHQLAAGGRASYQSPLTTYTKTANWTASTVPTTRTLTATTTSAEATLCGATNVTPTFLAGSDYQLFAYTVPTGLQLRVTGIQCEVSVAGAAQPATTLVIQWWAGANASAVTLATADALGPPPTAWGTRPIGFGQSAFIASAAIGTAPAYHSARLDLNTVPLVVDSGRQFQVWIRAVQAQTATASETFNITCACPGYFE